MSVGLGVHFALSDADEKRLLAAATDDDVMTIVEEIEESGLGEVDHCDTDKAWDPVHRVLTDGKLEYDNGTYPLNAAVLGGRHLTNGETCIVSYVSASQVRDIVEALDIIEEPWFRQRYFAIDDPGYVAELGEDDFEYAWEGLQDIREFYGEAAKAGRAVIFTADA